MGLKYFQSQVLHSHQNSFLLQCRVLKGAIIFYRKGGLSVCGPRALGRPGAATSCLGQPGPKSRALFLKHTQKIGFSLIPKNGGRGCDRVESDKKYMRGSGGNMWPDENRNMGGIWRKINMWERGWQKKNGRGSTKFCIQLRSGSQMEID